MASELIVSADCAYPFDYSRLPRGVAVILGYVGATTGTPHVWSQGEVDTARATGRAWAPIWTPPAVRLSRQLGLQAGNEMVAALAGYQGLAGCPVFLDVEQHVWAADPAGAGLAVEGWQSVLHAAGHRQAWAYLPGYVGRQWAANWTGTRPAALPGGLIGWQYAGHVDGDRYDLSVFAPSVFAGWADRKGAIVSALDRDDRQFIVDQLAAVQAHLHASLMNVYADRDPARPHPAALVHLHAQLDTLAAQLTGPGAGGVDVPALAARLAADLGPALAAQLAAELARRLAG